MKWYCIKLWCDDPDAGVDVFGRYPSLEECAHAVHQAKLEADIPAFHEPKSDHQYNVEPNVYGYEYVSFSPLQALKIENLQVYMEGP